MFVITDSRFLSNPMKVVDVMEDHWMYGMAGRMTKNDFRSVCRELKSVLGKLSDWMRHLAGIESAALRRKHFSVDSPGHGSMEGAAFSLLRRPL